MCGFNYRFVPAVRLAREILEAGDLGDLFHFRARYLQSWGVSAPPSWRFDRAQAGSGAIGDLGAHIVDLGRYLVGEPVAINAVTKTFVEGHEVDDTFAATVEFANGVDRHARGVAPRDRADQPEHLRGERLARLALVRRRADERAPGLGRQVVQARPGHRDRASVHELLVAARSHRRLGRHVHARGAPPAVGDRRRARRRRRTAPRSRTATAAAEVCDAIVRSSETGRRVEIEYGGGA